MSTFHIPLTNHLTRLAHPYHVFALKNQATTRAEAEPTGVL
jgi:hypothetical protein